jgi:peptidase M42 family hydrolase
VKRLGIDSEFLTQILLKLLDTPSPSGYTDGVVHLVSDELNSLSTDHELTRRGAIRATIPGSRNSPDRAIVAHLDTIGAMVTMLKDNGRLAVDPVGNWSSRFAEGARVTVFTDEGSCRGTILPLLASGHVYGEQIDRQPVSWEHVEVRVDVNARCARDLEEAGFAVGDYVAVDPHPEFTASGFIVARHLDDKAGVACLLAAIKAVQESGVSLPVDCHPLFTIFEEVGSGASAVLHQDVSEMVSVDNAATAPGKNSTEHDAHVALMDGAGPFDYHLSRKLISLAREFGIPIRRDVFRYYRSDAATAVEAGNDIRTTLLCFGVDGSHGYERTHIDGLRHVAELIALYMQSEPTFERDAKQLGPVEGFPEQPT